VVEDKSSPTPEKQLLKLIEEPASSQAATRPARGPGLSLSLGAVRSRLAFWQKGLGQALTGGLTLDIRKVNALLAMAAVVSGAYFVGSSAVLANRLSQLPNFSFSAATTGPAAKFVLPSRVQPLDSYLQMARSRNLFQIGASPAATESDTAAPAADTSQKQREEKVLSQFRLVGISWSDDPDAMIENKTEAKTYFIKRGQEVGGVSVAAIYKDRVILSYEGTEVELR